MPSDEPSRPYNWRRKSLAKLKIVIFRKHFLYLHCQAIDVHIDESVFAFIPASKSGKFLIHRDKQL